MDENEAIGLGLDDLFYLVLWIGTGYFLIPYLLLHRVSCSVYLDFQRKRKKKKGRWEEYNYRPKASRLFSLLSDPSQTSANTTCTPFIHSHPFNNLARLLSFLSFPSPRFLNL